METNKTALMLAAIDTVAENGLHGFSMKKVTDRLGVSEALIYKHFGTKENLLYTCFESIHRRIGNLFANFDYPQCNTKEDIYTIVKSCWMLYFDFLVKNGNATLFYFIYRDSSYVKKIREHDDEAKTSFFKDFVGFFNAIDSVFHIYEKTSADHLWTYILDTSGIFAKCVIRGELPATRESTENIWMLISRGMFGLLTAE